MKIRNWCTHPSKNISMRYELFEDDENLYFKIKLNDKDYISFEKLAEMCSEDDGVPIYSFRCFDCKNVFLLPLIGGNAVFRAQNGKIDIKPICKICNEKNHP